MTTEKGGRPASSKVWKMLSNEGPQTAETVGNIRQRLKKDGVRKFRPSSSYRGASMSGSGQSIAVYYIESKHEPKTVIKKWIEAQPNAKSELSEWAIHQRIAEYGDDWKDASREIFGPFDYIGQNGHQHDPGGVCDLCGEEYSNYLPDHLPECDGV